VLFAGVIFLITKLALLLPNKLVTVIVRVEGVPAGSFRITTLSDPEALLVVGSSDVFFTLFVILKSYHESLKIVSSESPVIEPMATSVSYCTRPARPPLPTVRRTQPACAALFLVYDITATAVAVSPVNE